jgi:hypothetical protein
MLKKTLFTIAGGFFIAFALQAQPHQHAWFRATLGFPVTASLKTEVEFQHRRQNGFGSGNMFQKNLMYTFRPWIHYQHDKHIKFSLSPVAFFSHYRIVQSKTDETAVPMGEWRISAAMELQKELFRKFHVVNRTALEYRTFKGIQPNIIRLRNRIGIRYDLAAYLKLSIYDEWLVNLAGTTLEHYFDHNRIGVQVGYQLSSNLKVDLVYLHISRLPLTSMQKLSENNIMLTIGYELGRKNRKMPNSAVHG